MKSNELGEGSVAFRQEPSRLEFSQSPKGSLLGNNVITSHLRELEYPERSIKSMLKCGEKTGFKAMKVCSCGTEIIPFTYNCCLRTCERCAKMRKRRIVNKYLSFLESLYQNRMYFLYFLTISPENYKDLDDGLNHIKKSFSKFIRHKYIKERIKGGFYVIETKGKEGNWNIHIHAIIYGRYIDNKIRKEKDSKIVRLFMQSSGRKVNMHVQKQNSVKFTLNYMCKYISSNKDDFETDLDIAKYIVVTRKRRLIHSFGMFYKMKIIKTKQICYKCQTEITYVIDWEVVMLIEEGRNKPPDLDYWF